MELWKSILIAVGVSTVVSILTNAFIYTRKMRKIEREGVK